MNNIILIGFPGVGKHSIGEEVAHRLNMPFIDIDEEIEAIEGKPLPRIFKENGEEYYRDVEERAVFRACQQSNSVICSGGGVILRSANLELFKASGKVIYLTAAPEVILERLVEEKHRPILIGEKPVRHLDKLKSLMQRRAFDYIQTRNIIDVTCATKEEVTNKVILIYQQKLRMKLVGIIGTTLGSTLSPIMHNESFNYQKLDYHYQRFETDDLDLFISRGKKLGLRGFNVTFPYKVQIMKYLDRLSPEVESIGAVNTVLNEDDKLIGYNTDAEGALRHFKIETRKMNIPYNLTGKTVGILGAGGAARAIAYSFKKAGGKVVILARRAEQAEEVAERFECRHDTLNNISWYDLDVIINATPVGMGELADQTPIPVDYIQPHHVVYDIVYYPRTTRLLTEAARRGATIIRGLGMLVEQGALSYRYWTGVEPPKKLMYYVVRRYFKNRMKNQ